MKTTAITILTAILLTTGGCVYIYNNSSESAYDYEITVAVDRTGSHSVSMPGRETIKQAAEVKNELWSGYLVHLVTLSDVDLNKVYEVKIEPEFRFTANEYARKKKMENFRQELDTAIDKLLSEPAGRPSSSLYVPVMGTLERLSASKAKNKRLVVFSDLLEESSLVKFDEKKTLTLLRQKPDSIAAILEKEAPVPSLNGIEIYMIYEPVNSTDSDQHRIISNFYKKIFEQKGAKVFIGANLIP